MHCPICGEDEWEEIGSHTYRLADLDNLSPYIRRRYRVLFEVWFPGETEISITTVLCAECGFVTYFPRPDGAAIDAKYRFLTDLGPEPGGRPADAEEERQRGAVLYRNVENCLPKGRAARILDLGGGDGRLMREFHRGGHQCDLIDYREDVLPYATRIGSTEADIPRGSRYDLIVCSHVVEHLANPKRVLAKLVEHLGPGGRLFIEVPMEIWRNAPPHQEPVTHLNFFTCSSLQRLCEEVGLATAPSLGGYRTGTGWALCIRAIANKTGQKRRATDGYAEARRYLAPGIALRLKRRLLLPGTISGAMRYRLNRLAARG